MSFISNILGNQGQQNVVSPEQAAQAQANSQQVFQQQQALLAQLQGQNAVQNQSSVFQQQQNLANQLALNAAGQGAPSVAQAQLAQNTGQNVASQAALAAGVRGANANSGLIARQAGMTGATAQQQGIGQAATLGAQEQQMATQNLMNQQAQMAGLATNQVGQQANLLNSANSGALQNQGQILNTIGQQNAQNQQNTQWGAGILGGALNAAGPAMSVLGGGLMSAMAPAASNAGSAGALGSSGGVATQRMPFFSGGEVKATVAPVAKGPKSLFAQHLAQGGLVKGDHPANDVVPAMLSPGEVVIPRSVMQSKDPAKAAQAFVQAVMAKKGK
jgi:hypothetical protein